MAFEIEADERKVLVRDLDEFVDSMHEIYRERTGSDWDPYSPINGEGIALLIRARDDLTNPDGPWSLDGTHAELEVLFRRLRAGALKGLEIGADTGALVCVPDLNVEDPERTDEQLDTIGICDGLLARLREQKGGDA